MSVAVNCLSGKFIWKFYELIHMFNHSTEILNSVYSVIVPGK